MTSIFEKTMDAIERLPFDENDAEKNCINLEYIKSLLISLVTIRDIYAQFVDNNIDSRKFGIGVYSFELENYISDITDIIIGFEIIKIEHDLTIEKDIWDIYDWNEKMENKRWVDNVSSSSEKNPRLNT